MLLTRYPHGVCMTMTSMLPCVPHEACPRSPYSFGANLAFLPQLCANILTVKRCCGRRWSRENLAGLSEGFFEDADMKWFLEVQALDEDDEDDEEEEELEDDDDEQGDTTFPKEEEFAIRGTMQDLNVSFEEASRVLGITKPNEVDIDELDPNVDAISGSR